jgi:hypothetical protein
VKDKPKVSEVTICGPVLINAGITAADVWIVTEVTMGASTKIPEMFLLNQT